MIPKIYFFVKHEVFKQRNVDNGQIGGAYSVFLGTFALLGFVTFVNTSISTYQSFWRWYFSPVQFISIIAFGLLGGMWFYYAIFTPSQQKYANRQSYMHENLLRNDLCDVKEGMNQVKNDIEILKTYAKFNGK